MIKKIDANKYGVVRYAISSIEDIADLPREVSVGSEAILVNEDGEKKFRLDSDGWVEVVEVKEYDEDKLRDILEDAKVGYGGIEYETLEERLDRDFDSVYSVLDNRTYIEYEGCRITAKDGLNGLQKESVIEGRTLQNVVGDFYETSSGATYDETTGVGSLNYDNSIIHFEKKLIKPNTKYTILINIIKNTIGESTTSPIKISVVNMHSNSGLGYCDIKKEVGFCRFLIQGCEELDEGKIIITRRGGLSVSGEFEFKDFMVLEGDHTQTPLEDLPFIEGIESVGDKSKNLFDGVLLNNKINNSTGIIIDRHSIEHYSSNFIQCDSLKTYTVSINYNNTVSELMLFEYDNEKNFIKKNSKISANSLTVTLSNDTKYIRLSSFKGYGFNEHNFDFQLEEGAQATLYKPHYDGYKISGKSCGKNLLNINSSENVADGARAKIEDNTLTVTQSFEGSWRYYGVKLNNLKLNTTYTFSATIIGDNSCRVRIFDTKTYKEIAHFNSYNGKVSFTPKINLDSIWAFFYTSYNRTMPIGTVAIFKDIMLEEGTTATSYEPYQETTYSYILDEPLRSLPNGICDEIDLEKGVVTRRVGLYTFTGDESSFGKVTEVTGDVTTIYLTIQDRAKREENNIICNSLACYPYGVYEDIQGILVSRFSCFVLSFKNETLKSNDIEGIRQWLKDNPTTVYYELANPITEYLTKGDKFVTLPNGVKDEISHNSVLRKVGKVVLDGSSDEKWEIWGAGINFMFLVPITNLKWKGGNPLLCDAFKCLPVAIIDEEGVYNGETGWMGFKISRTKLKSGSIDELREWLALNPITVWYELETPYTEPINPNEVILDTIRLKSYEPITHITSDNYLPPTIKTQVPSDFNAVVLGLKSNNEALASQVMSLRQTNDELETTNREQDDVIDVTLLALDEVYGMIDEGEIETMSMGSPMVNVYVKMIKRGIKTLDEVPAKYRAEVEELI